MFSVRLKIKASSSKKNKKKNKLVSADKGAEVQIYAPFCFVLILKHNSMWSQLSIFRNKGR